MDRPVRFSIQRLMSKAASTRVRRASMGAELARSLTLAPSGGSPVRCENAVPGATIVLYAQDWRRALVSYDSSQGAPAADDRLLPSLPAMPAVPRSRLYRGRPQLLVESGLRHSLGWQDHRQAGPSFVVVKLSRLDSVKVTSRFPLTEQGWDGAWRRLSGLDADAAAAVGAKLASMEERRSAPAALAALDADTVHRLRRMTYRGGSSDSPLARDQAYDLRFLADRLMVCPPASATAVVELPYDDVEAVEVSGSDRRMSPGEQLAVILGLGLAGALLGLFILGLIGFLLGALLFGSIGALATAGSIRIETMVRLRGRDAEFFFLNTEISPDAMRIELSAPLTAITGARTARQSGSGPPAERASESIPDQLSKLASLLADGVLSREEFEHLKAKVIAQP
jgi:hypothetical protein